jgi:hypothetical protein
MGGGAVRIETPTDMLNCAEEGVARKAKGRPSVAYKIYFFITQ